MQKSIFFLLIFVFAIGLFSIVLKSKSPTNSHKDNVSGPFATPQDVTKACLGCHESEADDFIKTRHWLWKEEFKDKDGKISHFGKINGINNFCVSLSSNEPRCTSCHAGYGWKDNTFDFTKKENIDCLVCHDQTGTYTKTPTAAGMPDSKVDLLYVAQNVGKPKKENCGACHFNGGGGTGVKHGDLDPSLLKVDKNLDVHMGGKNMDCITCHKAEKHHIRGASHGSMEYGLNHFNCASCHKEEAIHTNKILNKHSNSIACETCHIPEFAKVMPTKTYWDWSTAGQKEDQNDANGNQIYSKMKGSFVWEKNVKPVYRWHNGKANYYKIGDKMPDSKLLTFNLLEGKISDKNSKITPFKLMKGKQIYDKTNNYLIVPKLFGPDGYWKTYDWNKAAELGMKTVGLNYSGNYDFVETEMYWPINHMVAPKTSALKCNDCHNSGNRMDWKALGYTNGDPMKKGGREKNGLLK